MAGAALSAEAVDVVADDAAVEQVYSYRHLGNDETVGGTVEEAQVTAAISDPAGYKHIHFGVWAARGEAAKDGT